MPSLRLWWDALEAMQAIQPRRSRQLSHPTFGSWAAPVLDRGPTRIAGGVIQREEQRRGHFLSRLTLPVISDRLPLPRVSDRLLIYCSIQPSRVQPREMSGSQGLFFYQGMRRSRPCNQPREDKPSNPITKEPFFFLIPAVLLIACFVAS